MDRRLQALIVISIITVTGVVLVINFAPPQSTDDQVLNFYVFGDSQGYQGGISQIVASANENNPDFIFHCGDLTPFGQENQYLDTTDAFSDLDEEIPLYATPGNHDIRDGGGDRYLQYFGPATYSFDIGSAHITVFNTSSSTVTESEFEWLETDLSGANTTYKFVFSHIPPYDPRPGENHTMATSINSRLIEIFQTYEVDVVFSGHIHMFDTSEINDVDYVITFGAGAGLYAEPDEGGIYHYVNVTVTTSGITIEPVLLNDPDVQRNRVVIRGLDTTVTLTVEDLTSFEYEEAYSSVQNRFDNWRNQGTYTGVKISLLLEYVGGLNENNTIRIGSVDGFTQTYSYYNVYPNSSWYEIQGDLILAYQYNGTMVPSWEDGLRLVMLAPDGGYSNDDCMATSAPGMMYDVYTSAGATWAKYVTLIEVI